MVNMLVTSRLQEKELIAAKMCIFIIDLSLVLKTILAHISQNAVYSCLNNTV